MKKKNYFSKIFFQRNDNFPEFCRKCISIIKIQSKFHFETWIKEWLRFTFVCERCQIMFTLQRTLQFI